MAVVPRVLLDHVAQDPSQAGCPTVGPGAPGQPLQAAVGQRLRDQGAGAGRFQRNATLCTIAAPTSGGTPLAV